MISATRYAEVNFKNLLRRNSCESKSLCSTEKKPVLNRPKGKFYWHSAKFYGRLKRSRLPILGVFCYK